MRKATIPILILVIVLALGMILGRDADISSQDRQEAAELPPVEYEEDLANLIYYRQSVRDYLDKAISQEDIANVLWAGEGITVDGVSGPTRSSPSAGATDPLQIFLLAGEVEDLPQGIYKYNTANHELELQEEGDRREELARAALRQMFIADAPAVIVISADYDRTTARYGDRGIRYVHFEAGHAAQNLNLMAEEKGMGGVIIGAFDDREVKNTIGAEEFDPLLIIPLGYKDDRSVLK